eukprot:gene11585-220_t
MLRVLATLFRQVDAVRALLAAPPPALDGGRILAALLAADFAAVGPPYTPYPRLRTPGAPPAVWKALPRSEVGACQLSAADLLAAADQERVKVGGGGGGAPGRPEPAPFNPALRDFTSDAVSLGLAEEVDPIRHPASGRVTIIPKNAEKSLAITDLRWLNDRQPCRPRSFRLPTFETIKPLLLNHEMSLCVLDIANAFPSIRLPVHPFCPYFVYHVRDGGLLRAFRLLHLPLGWDLSPAICQRVVASLVEPAVRRHGGWAFVYLDDVLVMAAVPVSPQPSAVGIAANMRERGFVPHPRNVAGPGLMAVRALPSACIAPTDGAGADTIAVTVATLALPLCRRRREHLTGCLAWAGAQHRLALPFLGPLHRWNPDSARLEFDGAMAAGLFAAVVAVVPWRGQGWCDLALDGGRPVVYFDGVARPGGAVGAAFFPPSTAWRFELPAGTDQQQIELAAGVAAVELAAALRLRRPVIAGDSASALGAMRRLTCGAWLPGRAALLQRLSIAFLRSGVTASLAWVPGADNPADPPSRAGGGAL